MTDPNMPHRMSVKTCPACNGRGGFYTGDGKATPCPTCAGSGRYGYLPNGQRVAYDSVQRKWVKT